MSLRQKPSSSVSVIQPSTTSTVDVDDVPKGPPRPTSTSTLSQAIQSSAHLANLLPTGTLMAFQLLTPIFTNNGSCDSATQPMTLILLLLLGLSCLLTSFTDSIKSPDGRVYYGFVTPKGLWLFEHPNGPLSEELSKYRLTFIDVVHALLSILVFGSVALRDNNVVRCFYPKPRHEVQEVLDIVPFGIGFLASLLFVVFPTTRRAIGFPLTR